MWKLRMCVCQKLRKRARAREWEWDKNAVYYWHSLCCVMFFVRRSDAEVFIQGWMNSLRNVAAPNIVNVILNENIWQRNSKIELQIVGISGGTECMLYVLCVHSSEEQKLSYIMFLMLLLATAFFFCSPTFSQYLSLSLFFCRVRVPSNFKCGCRNERIIKRKIMENVSVQVAWQSNICRSHLIFFCLIFAPHAHTSE